MRGRLVLPLLSRGIQVITQARIDPALLLPPDMSGKSGRGRPRKYGQRLTAEAITTLPAIELSLTIYGKRQKLRIRSALALARFLKGAQVRAGWCEFYDDKKQSWAKPRLLLVTETKLSGRSDGRVLRPSLVDRTLVPQSETLVGDFQSLATIANRPGNLDANPLHRLRG